MYQVRSPILFLIFNRPRETQIVFNSIKIVKPQKLYVAADGPRNNSKDENLCSETRKIISQIDWNCELITLFRKENLGCGKAVSSAISWFFENEQEGIILEDDCLPSHDFYRFCDLMLDKYRNDSRIGHICGCNFQDSFRRGNADYYFSKLTHVWGWATWKRVWCKYDYEMSSLDYAKKNDILSVLTGNKVYKNILYDALYKTQRASINTWDYQYFFMNLINYHLSVIPNYNLISNIGFNKNGTHTFNHESPMSNIRLESLPIEIAHPQIFFPEYNADNYTLNKEMPGFITYYKNRILFEIKEFVSRMNITR